MFCFDNTWYLLERDDDGEYAYVRYADNKDNQLIEIYVTNEGYAEYKPWGITFKFDLDSNWSKVQVVKKHQSDVGDRLLWEWCDFDYRDDVEIGGDKTYDWYLANEILRVLGTHASQGAALLNLGNGILYNGGLSLSTNPTMGTVCQIHIRNDIQNEDVVTICELVKKYGESDLVQQMGTLFDRDMDIDSSRVVRGNLQGNLVEKSDTGRYVFFVKELGAGLNNVNTAWVDYNTWATSYRVESNVATCDLDEETQERSIQWSSSDYADTIPVKISPIYQLDDQGNETDTIIKFLVVVGDGSIQYRVWANKNYVHFVVNENRYRLNINDNTVDRLVVKDINVSTVDFSTSYNPTQLRDNLVQNVKTTMLYQIVQGIVDSKETTPTDLTMDFKRGLNWYLDLFTDSSSLENYVVSWNLDVDSDECAKFSQIYKNNLEDVDESHMVDGNVYGHLSRNISSTFAGEDGNQKSNILVVDSPSIEVTRITQGQKHEDTFTYEVLVDAHVIQNKDWMREFASSENKKYVIANAIVQDMVCRVEFKPIYDKASGNMTYDVCYSVCKGNPKDESGKYVVKYNQIVYILDGKTKLKTISPGGQLEVDFSSLPTSQVKLTYKVDGTEWLDPATREPNITKELVSAHIADIFKYDDYANMFVYINNSISGDDDIVDADSDTRVVIDNAVEDNPEMEDHIWPLGVDYIIPEGGSLVSINRGWTYIRGQTYRVSDDDNQLVPNTSGEGYGIRELTLNRYDLDYVVGILVPVQSGRNPREWEFKYLKTTSIFETPDHKPILDNTILGDDIASACSFATESDANTWKETSFFNKYPTQGEYVEDSMGRQYKRFNIGVFPRQTLKDDDTKKVATSERVIFSKNDVLEMFRMNSMGSGLTKKLFLTYIVQTDPDTGEPLPSRFHVKSSDKMKIVTDEIVNIEEYERSLKKDNTEEPSAMNYVYKSSSPGLCSV